MEHHICGRFYSQLERVVEFQILNFDQLYPDQQYTNFWNHWKTDELISSVSIFENEKPNHCSSTYEIWLIFLVVILCVFFLWALFYFNESLRNWLQRIISRCMRILGFQNRHSTATVQRSVKRPSRATTKTRNTGRATPLRVTQILPRNSNNNYTCPKWQQPFWPQGISNHIKSCAPEWCRTNGILLN
jgi:hypothetical protein